MSSNMKKYIAGPNRLGNEIKKSSVAPSSLDTYKSAIRVFHKWLRFMGIKEYPISTNTVCLWISEISRRKRTFWHSLR